MEYGLPPEDAKIVCQEKYAKEVVKLTIQIVDPSIKVIERDVSATFNDKLGVVGIYILRQNHDFVVQLKIKFIFPHTLSEQEGQSVSSPDSA